MPCSSKRAYDGHKCCLGRQLTSFWNTGQYNLQYIQANFIIFWQWNSLHILSSLFIYTGLCWRLASLEGSWRYSSPFSYLRSHVFACRTKVRLKIALKAEFLEPAFVFHLVDHLSLSLSMTGALNWCLILKFGFFSRSRLFFYLFLHGHERNKSIGFRREQTTQSLRPVDSQTER